MRDFRFFEEYTDDRGKQSAGNIIALLPGTMPFVKEGGVCMHAVCATGERVPRNAAVRTTLMEVEYLGTHCRRVSEARARVVHPKLFEYLDRLA